MPMKWKEIDDLIEARMLKTKITEKTKCKQNIILLKNIICTVKQVSGCLSVKYSAKANFRRRWTTPGTQTVVS